MYPSVYNSMNTPPTPGMIPLGSPAHPNCAGLGYQATPMNPPPMQYGGAAVASPIRYGIPFILRHQSTGLVLCSHGHKYPGGSRQQEVCCSTSRSDNCWWVFKVQHNGSRYGGSIGQPVMNGAMVRLEHLETGQNLHSHGNIPSPSSRQQEVTCFQSNKPGVGDANDNWRIEVAQGDPMSAGLTPCTIFRLIHVPTNHTLHSHNGHSAPVSREQEVTGFSGRDANDLWQIETSA